MPYGAEWFGMAHDRVLLYKVVRDAMVIDGAE